MDYNTNNIIHSATSTTVPSTSKHMSPLNTSSTPTPATSLPSPPHSPPVSATRRVFPQSHSTTKALKTTRRQSSISYVSSRVDVYSRHTSSTPTAVADSLARTDIKHASLNLPQVGGGPTKTSRSMKRRTMAGLESFRVSEARVDVIVEGGSKAPLTLADKHADLLHAIAAAESRRLELQGQLTAVEGELGDLKRKWERIVNREPPHPTLAPSSLHTSASVVDGLKEGVRLLAAGLSDLTDITSAIPGPAPATNTRWHTQRESDSSVSVSTGSGHGRLSISSASSVWDGDTSSSTVGKVTEDSETRKGHDNEVARARQAKVFRRRSRDVSHPPPAFTRHATSCSSTSTSVDLVSTPDMVHGASNPAMDTPIAITSGIRAHDADGPVTSGKPSKNTKRATLPPPSSMPGVGSITVVGEAWGSVGKKLGSDVFSKSQKRASVLLADVSQSIASALSPGPVATTPAPAPFTSSLRTSSSSTSSLRSFSPSTASLRTPTSNMSSPLVRSISLRTPTSGTLPCTGSWLEDDDEENTVHAGSVMMPSVLKPTSSPVPINAVASSSFDDDNDWNW
ncbi:hypothetical protein K503DRAFT_864335 [Rhizopogon vinicolor AM-OR11-026]|uniref:DUF4048 domain-containing protein n=1 Tax=Rhizopogon vinicolor AM-OR11-026 TaxID=1314800 RepID=A0A1B7N7H3_9AGAM|nr:hypothetical protein K503DRAFT_864335 [Rhizopogon vinicolor AM-OR11-026]